MIDINKVKLDLNITWDEPQTDAKVSDAISTAEAIINDYAGASVDYTSDAIAERLCRDCVRYIWNECLDEFEGRYRSQLIALRNTYKVIDYTSDDDDDECHNKECMFFAMHEGD